VAAASSKGELGHDLLDGLDPAHRDWAAAVFKQSEPHVGPILRPDGSIIVEPLFWIEWPQGKHAFLKSPATPFVAQELEDAGFAVLTPGTMLS
jgi:hypothetical protein